MSVFGITDHVNSGDMAFFFLRAGHDENTGGYYVYYSRDFSDPTAEGCDEWFERRENDEMLIGSLDLRSTEGEKP